MGFIESPKLPGSVTRYYLDNETDNLGRAYDTMPPISLDDLRQVGRSVWGYVRSDKACTTDGYIWRQSLVFRGRNEGEIAVLFPHLGEWNEDNTHLDRCIAAYTKGNATIHDVSYILKQLAYELSMLGKEKQ